MAFSPSAVRATGAIQSAPALSDTSDTAPGEAPMVDGKRQRESTNGRLQLIIPLRSAVMLYYAVVFFVIAIIAAILGFGGIAAGAAGIAKVLFVVFLILAVLAFMRRA
jgi:uncharacterized membrane protein YtjA (UPF0391 family)